MIHRIIIHGRRGRTSEETHETQEAFTDRLVELSIDHRLEVYGPVAHAWRDVE